MTETYEELNIILQNKPSAFQSIYKKYNVSNGKELYLMFKQESKCIYCNETARFISFKQGYSDICSSKECISLKLSSAVKEAHTKITEEDKKIKNKKISETLKTHTPNEITFEQLQENYPELKLLMSDQEIIEFYNKHKKKTKHITFLLTIWNKTRKDIHILLNGIKYCSECGKESLFDEEKNKYRRTCSKECELKIKSKTSKSRKGLKFTQEHKDTFTLQMKLKTMINIEDINETYWRNNFIVDGLFDEDKAYTHHNISKMCILRHKRLFNIENSNIQRKCVTQKSIYDFIKQNYDGLVLFNDRKTISPLEIDIYIPDLKFGIEFNGILSHTYGKHKLTMYNTEYSNIPYEYNKLIKAEDNGITLFNICETQYSDKIKRDIWNSMIVNKLNKTPRKIYARQCEIRNVNSNEANLFLSLNHIQGGCISKHQLGLYYKNELVFLLTFGKPRFNKEYEYELIRSCSKKYTTVIGGFSRLLKYFLSTVSGSLLSYADRRWSQGNIYRANGFVELTSSAPAMFYYKDKVIINRLALQKHKLKHLEGYSDDKTAEEILYENGYRKGFTCGNRRFILSKS